MIDGKPVDQNRLFDTTKSKKVCDVQNTFGYKVETIYLSNNGMLFIQDNNYNKLSLPTSQEDLKKWIGQNEPDKYIKFFGEVEEG
jgi:translation elongation factor P/translation initiation factor 5A